MFLNQEIAADYFPLSIASGKAFCNRTTEIAWLKASISQCRPILLVSPRRYGKTSLILRVINQMNLPFAHVDLFSAIDEQDIEKCILRGIGKLISRIETVPKRALALATEVFEKTNIRVSLWKAEIAIEVNKKQEKPAYNILDILERLESLSKKSGERIILFFDEFQQIGEITPDHAIEAVLRQVAQLTKSISFIFSGSNRHLLNKLFEDRNRPFYKLCERITLDRIDASHYEKHIQNAALKTWNLTLSDKILERIFRHTERHSYYVNLLCSRLWRTSPPTLESVDQMWAQYAIEERSNVAEEMDLLSKNQRKLLTIFSRMGGIKEPLGQDFVRQANISKTSINQALDFLEKKDFVFKDQHGIFKVLDPLIRTVLSGEE
jgi:hypothetical protein